MKVKDLVGILTQEGINPESEVCLYLVEGEACVVDVTISEVQSDEDLKHTLIELSEVVYD